MGLIDKTIRVIGDSKMPERVLFQFKGALRWCARAGVLVGITLCRSGPCVPAASALVVQHGRLACHRINVDNAGAGGAAVSVHNGAYLHFDRTTVTNAMASGMFLYPGAKATMSRCKLDKNRHCGLSVAPDAACFIRDCCLSQNGFAQVAVSFSVYSLLVANM